MKSNEAMTSTKTCIVIIIIKNDYTKACSESNNKPFLVQMKVDGSQKKQIEKLKQRGWRENFSTSLLLFHINMNVFHNLPVLHVHV